MNYDFTSLEKFAAECGADFKKDLVLAPYMTMRVGGAADFVLFANSEKSILGTVEICEKEAIPVRIMGRGSNILVSGKGISGVVILLGEAFSEIRLEGEAITADAGTRLSDLCLFALKYSLTGLEFAYGIPGTVGGALYMNAGAYGGEMRDIVVSCRCICGGKIVEMPAEEMNLRYRASYFSDNGCFVTSITVKLAKGDKLAIEDRMNELLQRRIDKQPLDYPSCGSTFKRPDGDYASRLIEVCGLKGMAFGGAQVSEKHSGFVINRNGASFDEIMELVSRIKKEVFAQTGIMLECEMKIWG